MKPIEINKNSWMFKVANEGDYNWEWEPTICSFTTAFLKGIFKFIGVGAICLFAAVVVIGITADFLAWIVFMIANWQSIMPNSAALTFSLMLFAAMVVLGFIGILKSAELARDTKVVKAMASSWKNKFCVPVTVVGDKFEVSDN